MSKLQELIAQKEAIDREIKAAQDASRADAITKVRQLMAENTLTLADLNGKTRIATASKAAAGPAKYRNAETGETWVGRGKRPGWLNAALSAGKTLEQFAAH